MKVIFHPTHGMNIDIQLSTNARNVSPQFGPKFAVYSFVPAFRAEHHMHHVLRVGMGHVPHLRCSAFLYTTHPALTRWAKVCRASSAGRKANSPFSSQRLRAGLKYVAPPALERGRADTARREGTAFRPLPGIYDAMPLHGRDQRVELAVGEAFRGEEASV